MASMAISSAISPSPAQGAGTPKAASAQAETTSQPSSRLQEDTVKLSPAAQAKMMHRAGQSAALIAATLGTNVAAVDGYLNIKVAVQAPATPAVAPTAEAEPPMAKAPSPEPAPAVPSDAKAPAPETKG
jgi:hypothetical protein